MRKDDHSNTILMSTNVEISQKLIHNRINNSRYIHSKMNTKRTQPQKIWLNLTKETLGRKKSDTKWENKMLHFINMLKISKLHCAIRRQVPIPSRWERKE